jgi:hypothetical protein
VHTVRSKPERRLDVVVHDEEGVELGEALAGLDQLVRASGLAPQLHDRGTALDCRPRCRDVLDDRVQPHETLARESSFFGSRS